MKLIDKVVSNMGMAGLKLKANSPELLLAAGILTMGGALVCAWQAGRKTDHIMADHLDRVEDAKIDKFTDEKGNEVSLTEKEVAKAVRKEYVKTAGQLAKTFAPTAVCTGLSVASFVGMHNIQAGMISGLSAAYTGLQEAYRRYEENNIKLNGEEAHRRCKYGFVDEKYEDEDGYTNTRRRMKTPDEVKEDASLYEGGGGDHIYIFGRTSGGWKGVANLDILVLESVERWMRQRVTQNEWLTVNEVLEHLGLSHMCTKKGMVEGWWKNGGDEPSLGYNDPLNQLALNGHNNQEWILQFNVHGNIYKALDKAEKLKEAREMELAELRANEEAMIA